MKMVVDLSIRVKDRPRSWRPPSRLALTSALRPQTMRGLPITVPTQYILLRSGIPRRASKAPDRPTPALSIAVKPDQFRHTRRSCECTRPKRPGRQIALGHRYLPATGIARQDLADRRRRHPAAPMFTRDEKLRHVVFGHVAVPG